MRFISCLFLLLILFSCYDLDSNEKQNELMEITPWFKSFEYLNENHLSLGDINLPQIIFFDSTYVYYTSDEVKNEQQAFHGPSIFNYELRWYKEPHNDTLTLPTGDRVPVNLISFAAPIDTSNYFFVMALPSYWKQKKVADSLLGTDDLYQFVFLHEFSHVMQYNSFGKQLTLYDSILPVEIFDDMIQATFADNPLYDSLYQLEVSTFKQAFYEEDTTTCIQLTKKGIELYHQRQKHFFVDSISYLKELDDFFLTMEGMGQFLPVLYFTNHPDYSYTKETFIKMKSGNHLWSQEEGLILFLLYEKLGTPNYNKEMFGYEIIPVIELLEKAIAKDFI